MAIPQKLEDLKDLGYVFDGEGRCKGCDAEIEWFITPRGKKMPMSVKAVHVDPNNECSPVKEYIRVPHWSDCPEADRFRGSSK